MTQIVAVTRKIKEHDTTLRVQTSVAAESLAVYLKTTQKEALRLLASATEQNPVETEVSAFWPIFAQ